MTAAELFLRQHGLDPRTMRPDIGRWLPSRESTFLDRLKKSTHEFQVRDLYIQQFGFAVLTEAAVSCIKKYAPLLEVGAGSGYWSYELQTHKVDIVATDPKTGKYRDLANHWQKYWTDVHSLSGLAALKAFPGRNLLTVWPDMSTWPSKTLKAFTGEYVLYVGEGDGGATADHRFHVHLRDNFEGVELLDLPVFFGLHDHLEVWKRK